MQPMRKFQQILSPLTIEVDKWLYNRLLVDVIYKLTRKFQPSEDVLTPLCLAGLDTYTHLQNAGDATCVSLNNKITRQIELKLIMQFCVQLFLSL